MSTNSNTAITALRPLAAAIRRETALAWTALAAMPGLAFAGPAGEQIMQGTVGVARPDDAHTRITQASERAIVNWHSFSVGGDEYVQFVQPGSTSAILNRVVGGDRSEILGRMDANGRVFLVNTQGVYFGPGAKVDAAGFAASALDIDDADFMAGRYVFAKRGGATARVTNEGEIRADQFVALLGERVDNSGLVQARLGTVALAAGDQMTLELDDDGLVGFAVDEAAVAAAAGVQNAGQIVADGGRVIMTAKVADGLVATAINNSGLVRARSVAEDGGEIYLRAAGGDIVNSGTIDASGAGTAAGGRILVKGDHDVRLTPGSRASAVGGDGAHGGGVRLVAGAKLAVEAGALVDARGSDAARAGGTVEVSARSGMTLAGAVEVGAGGTILVDPERLRLDDGSALPAFYGSSSASAGTASVSRGFIEAKLLAGENLVLVASQEIFASAAMTIDGEGGDDGNLALRIGTLSSADGSGDLDSFAGLFGPSSDCLHTGVCDETAGPIGGVTFNPSATGHIRLAGVNFNLAAFFDAQAGTATGEVILGHVAASDMDIRAGVSGGNIATGNLTASNPRGFAAVDLDAPAGSVTVAGAVNVTETAGGSAEFRVEAGGVATINGPVVVSGGEESSISIVADTVRVNSHLTAIATASYGDASVSVAGSHGVDLDGAVEAKSRRFAFVSVENYETGDITIRDPLTAVSDIGSGFVELMNFAPAGRITTVENGIVTAPHAQAIISHSGSGGGIVGPQGVIDLRTNTAALMIGFFGTGSVDLAVDNTAFAGQTTLAVNTSFSSFGRVGLASSASIVGGFHSLKVRNKGDLHLGGDFATRNAVIEVTDGSLTVRGMMVVGSYALPESMGDPLALKALSLARRPDGRPIGRPLASGLPTAGPNAVFWVRRDILFETGLTFLDPDTPYVMFQTDGVLNLSGGVFAGHSLGNDFLAQFTGYTPASTIHVEERLPSILPGTGPVFTNEDVFRKLPGTTLILGGVSIGGLAQRGDILIGQHGPIDIGDQNILFAVGGGKVIGRQNIRSSGFVGELDLFASALTEVFKTPIVNEFSEDSNPQEDDDDEFVDIDGDGLDDSDKLVTRQANNGQMCE